MKQSDLNPGDENLARLLRLAGPRPEPSAEVTAEVYDSVRSAWAARRRRQSRIRYALQGAVAASVIAMVTAILWPAGVERPGVAVNIGNVNKVAGTVSANIDGGWRALLPGEPVSAGIALKTDTAAGLGLQLSDGVSVRLAADTRLVFESAHRLQLDQGRVYIDTADARRGTQYEVVTASGVIRNTGTQFEVFSDGQHTGVRVRGGEVVLNTGTESLHARRGEALLADSGGRIERSLFASDDPQWEWVGQLAPPFETNNSRVIDLVDWVARETGREVEFADSLARNAAAVTRIRGSITGLAPEQLLTAALATTHLQAQMGGARIVISRKSR